MKKGFSNRSLIIFHLSRHILGVKSRQSMKAMSMFPREILSKPFVLHHSNSEVQSFIQPLQSVDGNSRIIMEYTERYYELLVCVFTQAVLFFNAVNPQLIKDFSDNSLRNVKSGKADAVGLPGMVLWTNYVVN